MQDTPNVAAIGGDFAQNFPTPVEDASGQSPAVDRISAKRIFDVTASALTLICFLVLFLLVALAIKVSSKGPVLFRHARIGRNGERFDCLKFRTMHVDGDEVLARHFAEHPDARTEWETTQKLRRDPRVTALGRVLRTSSVDELPQLINVLRGDMSLVGPRPIVQAEVVRYGDHFGDYCSVRPGLTGLWQVSGRSDTGYDERVALDCEYVARGSFAFDIVIILRTLPAVFAARGAC